MASLIYSPTAALTVSYNLGAIAGVAYGCQTASGILMAMVYCGSEEHAYAALDYVVIPWLSLA